MTTAATDYSPFNLGAIHGKQGGPRRLTDELRRVAATADYLRGYSFGLAHRRGYYGGETDCPSWADFENWQRGLRMGRADKQFDDETADSL